jgi:hypothetical protein
MKTELRWRQDWNVMRKERAVEVHGAQREQQKLLDRTVAVSRFRSLRRLPNATAPAYDARTPSPLVSGPEPLPVLEATDADLPPLYLPSHRQSAVNRGKLPKHPKGLARIGRDGVSTLPPRNPVSLVDTGNQFDFGMSLSTIAK